MRSYITTIDSKSSIPRKRADRPEQVQGAITVSLKVDEDTKMGIVTDVKQQLRKVQSLKISYSTREKVDKNKF